MATICLLHKHSETQAPKLIMTQKTELTINAMLYFENEGGYYFKRAKLLHSGQFRDQKSLNLHEKPL